MFRRRRQAINPPPTDPDTLPSYRVRRDRSLRVCMTEEELADLKFLADSRGMSVSEWVRFSVDLHLTAREKARVAREGNMPMPRPVGSRVRWTASCRP